MGKIVRLAFPKRQVKTASPASPLADIPREAVDEQLRRILSSKIFGSSERLRRLLQFVSEETLNGRREQLKEYNLGVSVFDRGAAYDPRTDPIVRVEAGRLRTRLSAYYASEGVADPLVIGLPKGGYGISVESRRAEPEPQPLTGPVTAPRYWKTIALFACTCVAVLLLYQGFAFRQHPAAAPSPAIPPEMNLLWAPFLTADTDPVIVFGSPIFFESERKRLFVRPYDVNDPSNLANNPAYANLSKMLGPLTQPQYAYAQIGDALALHRLGAFFGAHGKNPRAIPAHLATWDSIRGNNIIFVGSARMMPLLAHLPVQLDFDVQREKSVLNRNPRPSEKEVYETPSHANAFSYTVIASSPGLAPNRSILIITSHGSAGTNAGVEYVTNIGTLRELYARLRPEPGAQRYYQVLLRVLSDKDQAFKTEYITHHSVVASDVP